MKSYEEFLEKRDSYDNGHGISIKRNFDASAWNVKNTSSCQRVLSTSTLIEENSHMVMPTTEELQKRLSERRYMQFGDGCTTCETTKQFEKYSANYLPANTKGQIDENFNSLPACDQDALQKSAMRSTSAVIITAALSVSPKNTYQLLADKAATVNSRPDSSTSPPQNVRTKPKKAQRERNIKIVDVESVSGYRGKDPIDMLVKFIESDAEEKPNEKKTNKLNAEKKKERKKKHEKMVAAKFNAKLSEAKNSAKTDSQKQQPIRIDTSSEGEVSDLAEAVQLPQSQTKKSSNTHTNVVVKPEIHKVSPEFHKVSPESDKVSPEFHKVLPRKESKKTLMPAAVVCNQDAAKPVGITYVKPKQVLSTTTKTPQNKTVRSKTAKPTSAPSKTPKGVVTHTNSVNKRHVLGLKNQTQNNTLHAKADNVVNVANVVTTPTVMANRKMSSGSNENLCGQVVKPKSQEPSSEPVKVSPPRDFNNIELLADTAINLCTPEYAPAPLLLEDNATTPLTADSYAISNMENQFPTLEQAVKLRKPRVSPNKISPEPCTTVTPTKSPTTDITEAPVVVEEAQRMTPSPIELSQTAEVEFPEASPPIGGITLHKQVPKRPAVLMLNEGCDTDDDSLDELCFGDFNSKEIKMILSDGGDEQIADEHANDAMPCISQFFSDLNEHVKYNDKGGAPEQEQLETCENVESAIIAAARANQQQEEYQQAEPVSNATRRRNAFLQHNVHIVEHVYSSWMAIIESGDYTYCWE